MTEIIFLFRSLMDSFKKICLVGMGGVDTNTVQILKVGGVL